VIAQFTIDNKDRSLWPGSYATVSIAAAVKKYIFTIPTSCLVFNENGTQVATVTKDNRVHFKPIKTNKITDAFVEVTEGINEEDHIINNPKASLLEDDLVKVLTSKEKNLEEENEISQINSNTDKKREEHD
jgi:multidrug efflux pump subunit AcrA (membrane-fusion protein)